MIWVLVGVVCWCTLTLPLAMVVGRALGAAGTGDGCTTGGAEGAASPTPVHLAA